MKYYFQLLLILTFVVFSCQNGPTSKQNTPHTTLTLDLDKPEDNMTAYVKVRGSLKDKEEVIFYTKGKIYGHLDGEREKHLMNFEKFNIGKVVKRRDNSYFLLTKEVLLYTNQYTGKILEDFKNPYTGETVKVIHAWNSPVSEKWDLSNSNGNWHINHSSLGKEMLCMNVDLLLDHRSRVTIADFPKNIQSDRYEATEFFQFFFSKKDLYDPNQNSIPCTTSWTRIGQWLPWMEMGQKQGRLVYQGAGYKLMGNEFDKIPKKLTEFALKNHPEFRHPPESYTHPNGTSWTYFKELKSKEQ